MSEDQTAPAGSLRDGSSAVGSARSAGRSSKSGRSKFCKMTPDSFEDIDRYLQLSGRRKQTGGAEEATEINSPTLMDTIMQNSVMLGCMTFLMFVTLLCSSVPDLALWLAAIQVFGMMIAAFNWEGDQYLARGGKYRGCRICCQVTFILLPLCISGLLIWVAGTYTESQNYTVFQFR